MPSAVFECIQIDFSFFFFFKFDPSHFEGGLKWDSDQISACVSQSGCSYGISKCFFCVTGSETHNAESREMECATEWLSRVQAAASRAV